MRKQVDMPLREPTPEQEARIFKLFKKLDVTNDGKISTSDLKIALQRLKIPSFPGQKDEQFAEQLVAEGDSNKDGLLDFKEFASWVLEHEEQLGRVFRKIDKKMDGYIDASEIKEAFNQLGISIDDNKAKMLVQRMDMEGNLLISEAEWKEFLLLQAGRSLAEIAHYWEHTLAFIDPIIIGVDPHIAYFGYAPVIEAEVSQRDCHLYLMGTLNTGDEAQIPDDFSAEQLRSGQALNMLLSAGLAGALSRTCTAPLDRLKVLRQVYGYQHVGSSASQAFRWMLREGGFRSLWRGNGVNVIKIAPETAIKYSFYDLYKRLLFPGQQSELALHQKFLAGSLAGATSQTMIYPLEVAKTRMCLRKTGQYAGGIANCLVSVYREGGIRAIFRGYTVNLAGILPYAGIELTAYETTRTWLFRDLPANEAPSVVALLMSGALASSIGIVACYPLALLRTKLQSKGQFSRPELNSVRGLARTVYRAEGLVGFYRGMGANLFKVLPSVAISFATFERINHYFHIAHPFGSSAPSPTASAPVASNSSASS